MNGLQSLIRTWTAFFKDARCAAITTGQVEPFLDEQIYARGLAFSTRNRHIAQLKAMFNWGMTHEPTAGQPLVTSNPVAPLRKRNEKTRWRTRFRLFAGAPGRAPCIKVT